MNSPNAAQAGATPTDPATPEVSILRAGIRTLHDLDAVMGRRPKGPTLIRAIAGSIEGAGWIARPDMQRVLGALLGEPSVGAAELALLARVARGDDLWESVAAICGHRAIGADTIIDTLWSCPRAVATATGRATDTLLPAATWWVRSELIRQQIPGPHRSLPTGDQRARILTTEARWVDRTAGARALATFLAAASWRFIDEELLFGVGAAITATTGPGRPR